MLSITLQWKVSQTLVPSMVLTSVMAFFAFSSAFLHSWMASSTSVCSWEMSASIFFFWLMRLVFWS